MAKNRRSVLLLVLFLLLPPGCAGLNKKPPVKQYFDLQTPLPPIPEGQSCTGEPLLIRELIMGPAFDSHAFIYRTGQGSYQADFYNEFITYPARLITEKITEGLCRTPYFTQPLTATRAAITHRLSGKVTRLYGDFTDPASPKAVMEIRLVLEKRDKADPASPFIPVFSRSLGGQVALPSAAPGDLARGWGRALADIINRFIEAVPDAVRD